MSRNADLNVWSLQYIALLRRFSGKSFPPMRPETSWRWCRTVGNRNETIRMHFVSRDGAMRAGSSLYCCSPHSWLFPEIQSASAQCQAFQFSSSGVCLLSRASACSSPRARDELEWPAKTASAGNRTRAARVAGEHSTTEPPMHAYAVGRSASRPHIEHTVCP